MRSFVRHFNIGPFRLILRKRRVLTATSQLFQKVVDGFKLIHFQIAKGKFSVGLQFWRRLRRKD